MNSRDPALPAIKVTVQELAGAVGDFGTIIPLVVGVAIVSGFNAGYILLFFGLWFILTGLYYRLPIPIEPMKAIAVVAIAEGLALGQVVAEGLLLGLLFLFLGTGSGWSSSSVGFRPQSSGGSSSASHFSSSAHQGVT